MAQPKSKPKQSMQRGVKVLIASLSVATTLSGWAWLTRGESLDASETATVQTEEPIALAMEIPVQPLTGVGSVTLAPLPTKSLPNLAKLPVRGLRQVGDATAVPPQVAPPQTQSQAPRERNGAPQVSAPADQKPPPSKPEPPPKPKRKTKSSK